MHVEVDPPDEFPLTQVAVEWFLSCVNTNVGFHIQLCEKALVANLANKRFNPPVHHLEMFGEAKFVDKGLPAFLAHVDLPVAMHPAVPLERFSVREAFATESAGKRPSCVEANVAFQGRSAAQDLTTHPALVLEQAAADEGQRLQRRHDGRRSDGGRLQGKRASVGSSGRARLGFQTHLLWLICCGVADWGDPHAAGSDFLDDRVAGGIGLQLRSFCAVLYQLIRRFHFPQVDFCLFSPFFGVQNPQSHSRGRLHLQNSIFLKSSGFIFSIASIIPSLS